MRLERVASLALLGGLALTAGLVTRAAEPGSSGGPMSRNARARLVPEVGGAVRFAVSPPMRELPKLPESVAGTEPDQPEKRRNPPVRQIKNPKPAGFRDPVWQASLAAPQIEAMSAPLGSFEGVSSFDNQTLLGLSVVPPDTNGDIGPSHYVQVVNVLFEVFDRSGTSLAGPATVSSLFSSLGAPCNTEDDGDPVVLYDPLADRWLLSQFALPSYPSPPFHECIAVSTSGDPTGTWYVYDFLMPNSNLNDYPKLGVWPDAYYMTDNQFLPPTLSFNGAGAFAFDRVKMLQGDPTASFVYFDLNLTVHPEGIGGMLPADLDGPPPPPGTPGYFAYFISTVFGDSEDGLRVFEFHADFLTPSNSTFTERPESPVAVASFDPNLCNFARNCIPQPPAVPPASGTSQPLDAISDRLMHRLQYRNFGSDESLVVNHTVDVGANHAGVRYYQLRRTPGGSFSVNEQATFAPDASHRWMGSAAMDKDANLAVGFSVSSSSVYPSLRYAGRLATDPPNGLAEGEATLQAGSNSQTTSANRWGDYSMLSVDPVDDCTFWYTNEYYSTAVTCPLSNFRCWQTRVGSFRFPTCSGTPVGSGTLQGTVSDALTGLPVAGAVVLTTDGYAGSTDAGGNYSIVRVYPGTYEMTASAALYASASASNVNVGAGGTTVQNFSLVPLRALSIDDVPMVEGNAGTSNATFTVTLSSSSVGTVTVDYATVAGSASSGVDYTSTTGVLSFSPGQTSKTIPVAVIGDTLDEPNETFTVELTNPNGAALLRARGLGTIVDDDGPGSTGLPAELVHGFDRVESLAALPGPVQSEPFYLVEQKPYAAYEVVVDGISGDVQPLAVDLLAADGTTVLHSASAVSGVGSSLSLRFENLSASPVSEQRVRIRSGGCTTGCTASDTYRIRAYETTCSIPRFNNSGTQTTVLILQNPTSYAIAGAAEFWNTAGTLLGGSAFDLAGKATLVLPTASVPGVAGASGAITIVHDGRYGDLVGKTVALEPATGFSFDSPMIPRFER